MALRFGTTTASLTAASVATTLAFDRQIDRTNHRHDSFAYRHAFAPMWALTGMGVGSSVLALGALALPGGRPAARTLGIVAGASAIAWVAHWTTRIGYGMLVSPTSLKLEPGDVTRNSINRASMMNRDLRKVEVPVLDWWSRHQGHGPLADRFARYEFIDGWGGHYDRDGVRRPGPEPAHP